MTVTVWAWKVKHEYLKYAAHGSPSMCNLYDLVLHMQCYEKINWDATLTAIRL